jgi:hypothetical protein
LPELATGLGDSSVIVPLIPVSCAAGTEIVTFPPTFTADVPVGGISSLTCQPPPVRSAITGSAIPARPGTSSLPLASRESRFPGRHGRAPRLGVAGTGVTRLGVAGTGIAGLEVFRIGMTGTGLTRIEPAGTGILRTAVTGIWITGVRDVYSGICRVVVARHWMTVGVRVGCAGPVITGIGITRSWITVAGNTVLWITNLGNKVVRITVLGITVLRITVLGITVWGITVRAQAGVQEEPVPRVRRPAVVVLGAVLRAVPRRIRGVLDQHAARTSARPACPAAPLPSRRRPVPHALRGHQVLPAVGFDRLGVVVPGEEGHVGSLQWLRG